jgi:hypothetical protein
MAVNAAGKPEPLHKKNHALMLISPHSGHYNIPINISDNETPSTRFMVHEESYININF